MGLYAAVRRRPVRAYLYSLLTPGLAAAQVYGWISRDQAAVWISLGGAVLAVTGAELAQRRTTPTVDPRDDAGRRLVPLRTGGRVDPGRPYRIE